MPRFSAFFGRGRLCARTARTRQPEDLMRAIATMPPVGRSTHLRIRKRIRTNAHAHATVDAQLGLLSRQCTPVGRCSIRKRTNAQTHTPLSMHSSSPSRRTRTLGSSWRPPSQSSSPSARYSRDSDGSRRSVWTLSSYSPASLFGLL